MRQQSEERIHEDRGEGREREESARAKTKGYAKVIKRKKGTRKNFRKASNNIIRINPRKDEILEQDIT